MPATMTMRQAFPHRMILRPRGVRGMRGSSTPAFSPSAYGQAQLASLFAGPLGWLVGPDFYYNAYTGALTPDQVNTIKANAATQIVQASTDPNTGQVNAELAQAQIAQANKEIDAVIADAQKQSTGSTVADLYDMLQGTGPSASNFLANALGLSSTGSGVVSTLNVIADLLIIGAVGVGGYFLWKAIRD